jgi:two-component system chemotaxis response regulator CheY
MLAPSAPPAQTKTTTTERADERAPTALVIDDSPIMRAQVKRVLAAAGFTVVAEAATAEELTALYERHRPDLVTLDIVMPKRDGATAAAELLGRYPEATIVMCTSVTTRDKILACQRAGVRHYLLKPFDPDRAATMFRCAVEKRVAP